MAEASGRFVKIFVRGMRKHGQYRNNGVLKVTDEGVEIAGKHVYSLGQRWAFGVAAAIGILVVTLGTVAPGILLMYPVVEYLWLKDGDQTVAFDRIRAYNAVPEQQLIAIQFDGTPWESPVVLRTPLWKDIYEALWTRVPHARVQ